MATLHRHSEGSVIYVKGAPEALLEFCSQQQHDAGAEPLDAAFWRREVDKLARQGKGLGDLRLTAVKRGVEAGDLGQARP